MPFKSQAQRGYMFVNHPNIAKRWEKETPDKKLPYKLAGTHHSLGDDTDMMDKLKQMAKHMALSQIRNEAEGSINDGVPRKKKASVVAVATKGDALTPEEMMTIQNLLKAKPESEDMEETMEDSEETSEGESSPNRGSVLDNVLSQKEKEAKKEALRKQLMELEAGD